MDLANAGELELGEHLVHGRPASAPDEGFVDGEVAVHGGLVGQVGQGRGAVAPVRSPRDVRVATVGPGRRRAGRLRMQVMSSGVPPDPATWAGTTPDTVYAGYAPAGDVRRRAAVCAVAYRPGRACCVTSRQWQTNRGRAHEHHPLAGRRWTDRMGGERDHTNRRAAAAAASRARKGRTAWIGNSNGLVAPPPRERPPAPPAGGPARLWLVLDRRLKMG